MQKAVKWIAVIAGSLLVLAVVAVVVVSLFLDVEKYKPQIEDQVAKATGRTFRLGGDLKASFFPWIGIRLSDLHLGNPAGYQEEDFVSVESFEVRVKLLPLLSRNIEVRRFVLKRPRIVLEKRKDGKGGWEDLGPPATEPAKKTESPSAPADSDGLPIKGLMVGEFAITDGMIVYLDQVAGTRKEIKDIDLILSDVSLDKPVGLSFSALADQQPVELEGTIGPVGEKPGKTPMPLDLTARLLDQLEIKLNGRFDPSTTPPKFQFSVNVTEFSPRQVMDRIGQPLPVEPADSGVLNAVALALNVSGTPQNITVSDGTLKLDDTQATFSAQASEFEKPNLKVDLNVDRIDLDRYLPPPAEGEADAEADDGEEAAPAKEIDYRPLRRLVMDARIKTGDLKVKNARMQNITVNVSARNGIIQLDPIRLDLYKGNFAATGKVNVQKDQPRTSLDLALNGIQAGPLVKDLIAKELIEGAVMANIGLNFSGDAPDLIRQTLSGKGDLRFKDGAIIGIDLASMVRNVQAAFGMADKPTEKPRTDFAELMLPFTITNGLFKTDASKLISPLMRVLAVGNANLVEEELEFRVEPKFVATIKGQGDSSQRSGLMVPVLVSGKFTSPKFKPDLKGMLGQQLGQPLPDQEALKKKVTGDIKKLIPPEEETKKKVEEGVKGLIKGLPFGKQ